MGTAANVDEYIASQTEAQRLMLEQLRSTILTAVPDAVESIAYGMAAYRFPNGHPVYFAGWKRHVSLHDIPALPADLESRIAPLRSGKDTVKFPLGTPLPLEVLASAMLAISRR